MTHSSPASTPRQADSPSGKEEARAHYRQLLRRMNPAERARELSAMQSVLTSWVSGQGFGSVLAVLPLPTEADLSSPLRYWLDGGLTIALARMETPGLEFVKVVGLEGPWQPAGRSLRQPFPGEAWKPDSSRRTLLLVPGLAFAPGGSRLGRGGGYFDRFLAGSRPGVLALGYAFACQIAADLPTEPHDQPLDGLILGADSGILKAGVHLWH